MNLAIVVIIASITALLIIRYVLLSKRHKYLRDYSQSDHTPEFDDFDDLEPRYEHDIDPTLAELGFGEYEDDDALSVDEDAYDDGSQEHAREVTHSVTPSRSEVTLDPAPTPASKLDPSAPIISLNVFAQANNEFAGYDLLQALASCELCYGEMNIFHRYQDSTGDGAHLFSVASAKKPGTFNMEKMEKVSTDGLTLFMQLHGVSADVKRFDLMLEVAQQLAESLQGRLLDESRQPLTSHKIAAHRQRIQRYSFSTLDA